MFDDDVVEGTEAFEVMLAATGDSQPFVNLIRASATVSILDNEGRKLCVHSEGRRMGEGLVLLLKMVAIAMVEMKM